MGKHANPEEPKLLTRGGADRTKNVDATAGDLAKRNAEADRIERAKHR